MQDGYTQVGAGASDMRVAGEDLQHNRQTRTADELHVPIRRITQIREGGGPMKEHYDKHEGHKHHMHHHLEEEKYRHEKAMEHHADHIEKHHARHYDSQHGHDTYKY
jgi:hypothetical protein